MRGRTRFLVALALAAPLLLWPAPDATAGRPYLAYLRVREWLLDPVDSPLRAWQRNGRLPDLQVNLRQSPPIEDGELLREREQQYARVARQWAAARGEAGSPITIDASLGTLVLLVHAGTAGVQAEVAAPDGGAFTLVRPYASRWSLLPIGLAIVLAVATARVRLALLAGGLAGAIAHVATAVPGPVPGVFEALRAGTVHFFADALWQRSIASAFGLHLELGVMFVLLTMAVLAANGSLQALGRALPRCARGAVGAQLCSCACGLVLCFDELARCLVGGATMQPLCEAARVSREKLAYLVDATAAPLAAVLFVSPWLAREVAQVTGSDGVPGAADLAPYRFYCLFTLALAALVIGLRRDFGPMLAAERRARHGGAAASAGQAAKEPAPGRAAGAAMPLFVLVLVVVLGKLLGGTGGGEVLPWAGLASFATAVLLTLAQRSLLPSMPGLARRNTLALGRALGLLFLAWGLGEVCRDLGTASFLAAAVPDGAHGAWLPIVAFVLAGSIAFATGSAPGTIAVLLPAVPMLAGQVGAGTALAGGAGTGPLLLWLGAVLEGAVFGEHCSPIANTTLLSSLGARCEHATHVTTQLPYALLAFATSVLCGYLPMFWLGRQWWPVALAAGVGAMAVALRRFGRDPAIDDAGPRGLTSSA